MVKDVSAQNLSLPFGKISISVDEVLTILREMNFSNLTARNGDIEFDSIDDIENNKQLFSGEPSIYAGNISINISRHFGGVSFRSRSENTDVALLQSIHRKFIHKKGILDKLFDNYKYLFLSYIIVIAISFLFYRSEYEQLGRYSGYLLHYLSPLFTIFVMADLYITRFRKPVYYREREGFWRRNFDKIALTFIGAVIGWLAKWLAG